jgi:ABC-type molybdenum transport system ATPase subunit/photorepair protein PhrA
MLIRDRIKDLRRVPARQLRSNPRNWRVHPQEQQDALRGVLSEIGFADALLARELDDGSLELIDGHLRAETTPDMDVPVLVLDVTAEEADKLLATLDPLAAMAEADVAKLDALLREVQTGSEAVASMLTNLAEGAGIVDKQGKPVPPPDEKIEEQYSVLVKCTNERDQKTILKELDRHGLDVRALCVGIPSPVAVPATEQQPIVVKGRRITRQVAVKRTARVLQMEGMYDVPRAKKTERTWDVDLDLSQPWNVGLIVGPSGSGKSTIARELFGDRIVERWDWPADASILDGFPEPLSIQEVVGLLSSVGFSSPPAWVKPFHVLSNGEQFRVNLARTLAEMPELAVVDEFTSVVDRQVAQIGSAAVAKAIRARNGKFVAVTCHYDVEEWLQPDWKYDVSAGALEWRSLRRRPPLELRIRRVDSSWWKVFRDHHYLSHDLNRSARCFLGEVGGQPAAFTAVLHYPHFNGGWWREHRTVCLPDFQGVGIGNAMSEYVASLFVALGKEYRSTTSHPAMIRHRIRSPLWLCIRAPSLVSGSSRHRTGATSAVSRMTCGFSYVGMPRPDDARGFSLW